MKDVKYKQYSPEESMIHEETIAKIREAMKNGLSFSEACGAVNVGNEELRNFILDDTLKILIAEMHYAGGKSLAQVAMELQVSTAKINTANREMIEDAGNSAAEVFRSMNSDIPVGNA